jgi:mono/diheme cytochrome c family protein
MQRLGTNVVLAASLLAATVANARDIARGKVIAQVWCGNCHGVDPGAQSAAHDATPTFMSIARKTSTSAASLATFLKARHGGMPDLSLSRGEIADVSAYILSLRGMP